MLIYIYITFSHMIQNQISCEAKNYNTKQKTIAPAHLGWAVQEMTNHWFTNGFKQNNMITTI